MIHRILAIAWGAFREARRNRITVVIAAFAFALLLASGLFTEVTVATFDRVLTDVGLGGISLTLVALAIFLSSAQLPREIERRTIFLMVSKPLSRTEFLVGKLAGNMLTLSVLLVAMAGVFFLDLAVMGGKASATHVWALVGLWAELLVLSSVGFAISSYSSQLVSATVTAAAFIAGHLSGDIYKLAARSKSELLAVVGKLVYYVVPNLDRLNYRPQASYLVALQPSQVVADLSYAAAYSVVMVCIASMVFGRRDFK